jgi:hypothetical protein
MTSDTRVTEGDPDRVAVILPGRGYTADMPLLWYARTVLTFQGWTVHVIDWPTDLAPDQAPATAAAAIDRACGGPLPGRSGDTHESTEPGTCLIVAKSLGSLALPLAVQRGLPGVWLTPLLFEPAVAAAAENLGPGHLVIGGTGDQSTWDPDLAHHCGAQLLEIPHADHALQVAGDLDRTLAAVERVAAAINAFALEVTQPVESRPV